MKAALVVIDVQNEYFAPHGKWVIPDGKEALAQIQALLAACRQVGVPVFHVMHHGIDVNSPVFQVGSIGAEMHSDIEILAGEKVIVKHFPGSFTQTPLEAYLRHLDCDTLIVCGYMTHMCCDTTTRQASERGFTTLFASDATATRDLALHGKVIPHNVVHETTLAIMTRFATVSTTEEIISKIKA